MYFILGNLSEAAVLCIHSTLKETSMDLVFFSYLYEGNNKVKSHALIGRGLHLKEALLIIGFTLLLFPIWMSFLRVMHVL